MQDHYTIQEIVERTGVSAHTLRYYERIGLLDPVARGENGHRRYGDADIKRLYFLRRVKATGMKIQDMVRYVALFRAGDVTLTERRAILTEHRDKVQAQLVLLQETLQLLDTKLANYAQLEAEAKHK